MSLMDGQLDDINDSNIVDDPSLIQPPNPLPAIKQQITMEPVNQVNQGEAVKLKQDYEAKLPLMDIQIKTVEGQTTKITDMEDVIAQITTSGSVDQQAADDVNVVFENFYNETLTRNHFTVAPTKINLDKVTQFTGKRIAHESLTLAESIMCFAKEPLESIHCMLKDIDGNYLDCLSFGFSNLRNRVDYFSDWMKDPEANHFTVIEKQMVDMRQIDLIEQSDKPTAVSRVERFSKISEGLVSLFKDKSFGSYVRIVSLGKDGEKMSEAHRCVEYGDGALSMLDILSFYKTFDYHAFIKTLKDSVQDCFRQIEAVKAASESSNGKGPDACRKFYSDNAKVMAEINDVQKRAYHFTYSFLMFNALAEQLLDCYEQ